MKIAILSPFYPYRGGIAQFSDMISKEFMKEGIEVQSFNFKRLYPNFLFPGKTQYVDDSQNTHDENRVLDSINPISYTKTASCIKTYNPDVLIISYWMSFFVPAYAYIAHSLKNKCKIICLIHNAIPHEPKFFDKPLAKLFFSQCEGFIVMSDNVKKDLLKLKPQAQYIETPHPLYDTFGPKCDKTEARKRLDIDLEKKTLLFFGLIRDYKGLDILIEAMGLLDGSYQLMIAGECYGSFTKYEELINNSSAKARIYTHNEYISDDSIPDYFSAADALVLPYRSATQSGVVAVACNYDLPMIATPVGSFPQSIGDNKLGIVANEVSATSLAESIARMFTADNKKCCEEAISKEKDRLSCSTMIDRIKNFAATL